MLGTPPIEKFECDPDSLHILICYYRRAVPPGLQEKILEGLRKNYKEYVFSARWRSSSKVLRITLKHRCVCQAGAHCIQSVLKKHALTN